MCQRESRWWSLMLSLLHTALCHHLTLSLQTLCSSWGQGWAWCCLPSAPFPARTEPGGGAVPQATVTHGSFLCVTQRLEKTGHWAKGLAWTEIRLDGSRPHDGAIVLGLSQRRIHSTDSPQPTHPVPSDRQQGDPEWAERSRSNMPPPEWLREERARKQQPPLGSMFALGGLSVRAELLCLLTFPCLTDVNGGRKRALGVGRTEQVIESCQLISWAAEVVHEAHWLHRSVQAPRTGLLSLKKCERSAVWCVTQSAAKSPVLLDLLICNKLQNLT